MASSGNHHCTNYIGNFVPYGGFLPPILHCVIRKYRLLVPGPGRHLGQTSVTRGMTKYRKGPTKDRKGALHRTTEDRQS